MNRQSRVYVAGHLGLVGSALVRHLQREHFDRLLLRTRAELDLTDRNAVHRFFADTRPEYVFVAAAKVGGIVANSRRPVEFLQENLRIECNLLEAAHDHGVTKLLFLASSCIYPKHAPQPIREEHLLTGPLEPTNEGYALAKIAGIRLYQGYNREYGDRFIGCLPTNLYGPGDNFDLENSHVLPALMRKFHDGKVSGADRVVIWGTGTPMREFLHVDDLADACLLLMQRYDADEPINVGVGEDIAIRDLAMLIREIVGYQGALEFDSSRPDGTPRKLLDVSRITALGWAPRIGLREGIAATYDWFLRHKVGARA